MLVEEGAPAGKMALLCMCACVCVLVCMLHDGLAMKTFA